MSENQTASEIYESQRRHPRWSFKCDFTSVVTTNHEEVRIIGVNASTTGIGIICFGLPTDQETEFHLHLRKRSYPLSIRWQKEDGEGKVCFLGLEIEDLIFKIGIKNNDPECDIRYLLIQEQIINPAQITFPKEK